MDCPTCGRTNADGKDFCDCGEYLRWEPTGVFAIPRALPSRRPPRPPPTPPPRHRRQSRRSRCCSCCAPPAKRRRSRSPPPACSRASFATRPNAPTPTRSASTDSRRLGSRSPRHRWTCCRSAPRATPMSRTSSSRSPHRATRARVPAGTTSGSRPSRARPARWRPALPGAIEILPYHELQLEALPELRGGRRRVRFTATAATTGNAPIEIELGARDREEKFDLSFSPTHLRLEPNTPADAQLTAETTPRTLDRPPARADARRHRSRARHPAPADPDRRRPPRRTWIPFWLRPLVLVTAALAAAFVLTRPENGDDARADRRRRSAPRNAPPPAPASRRCPCSRLARPGGDRRSARSCEQEPARGADAPRDAKIVLVGRHRPSSGAASRTSRASSPTRRRPRSARPSSSSAPRRATASSRARPRSPASGRGSGMALAVSLAAPE